MSMTSIMSSEPSVLQGGARAGRDAARMPVKGRPHVHNVQAKLWAREPCRGEPPSVAKCKSLRVGFLRPPFLGGIFLSMESPAQEQVHGRVGRPRKFETHEVLTAALRVFLTRGYIGASVAQELTAAMGIARPSLYRFFGNKEGLFKRALELHSEHHLAYLRTAIGAPTAREVVERLLRRALADKRSVQRCGRVHRIFLSTPR